MWLFVELPHVGLLERLSLFADRMPKEKEAAKLRTAQSPSIKLYLDGGSELPPADRALKSLRRLTFAEFL